MILNFRKFGEGPPLLILHGVFGSADNWQTLGKQLATSYTVYLIDQRNHGQSFHSPVFSYEAMRDDLLALVESESLQHFHLIGHSMGGKTAMFFACAYPHLVRNLVVVDIAPRHYLPHHQNIFKGFHSLDLPTLTSRKEADEQMAQVIPDFGVRQFILKNLSRNEHGQFAWKLNLDAIEKNIENIGSGLPKDLSFEGNTLFVSGGLSDYITSEDRDQISHHFPNSDLATIDGAGHWVHAQKPQELLTLLQSFLSK